MVQQEVTFNTGSPLCIAYACMNTVCVGLRKLGPFDTTNGTPQRTIDILCHPGSLACISLSICNEIDVGNCIPVEMVYQRQMSITVISLHARLLTLRLAQTRQYTSTRLEYGSICSLIAQRSLPSSLIRLSCGRWKSYNDTAYRCRHHATARTSCS